MTKTHSTHFIVGWALGGLIFAALFLLLWPASKTTQQQSEITASSPSQAVSYADAVKKASAAVVSIQAIRVVEKKTGFISPFFIAPDPNKRRRENKGSGVIISNQGHILTNYHVIANAEHILVTLLDGRQSMAKILGSDPDTDLAVITIDLHNLPSIIVADANKIRVGDVVLAIGNPYGIGQTVTQGIISATGRDRVGLNTYENFIQTDAAINPGNSGGALINAKGEIVGINSAIFSDSGSYQGISFAIPINMSLNVVQDIVRHGSVIRGWLGVEGVDLNPQMLSRVGLANIQGVLITDVFTQGPADKSGLAIGDIITQIDQQPIRDTRDVLDIIARGHPGDRIKISGIRQRQSFTTQATLGRRPQQSN
jgi:Do/DeqQ family serine protease